jgi:MFS family permease
MHSSIPTRVRHGVVGFAIALAIITYIDRVCIAQAAPLMRRDLGLTTVQMAWAFALFDWAYALLEVPAGWMGDRIGARKALTRVVLVWSLFTSATGAVRGWTSLLVTRALFGAGQAGCFPNITRAFATWLPARERVRAQGVLWLSARWGGAFTPLVVVLMLDHLSWRQVFVLFGMVGAVWTVLFHRFYRDRPAEHPRINAAELALLNEAQPAAAPGPVPWRAFLRSRTVWLLWAQYFCLNYAWAFYVTWLPTYLTDARGVGLKAGGLLAGIPLFFGGLGALVCGWVSIPLARRLGSVARARRALAATGLLAAGLFVFLSVRIEHALLAMVVLGLASFANDLAMPTSWATCMDVGGRFAGTLSGSMNMMGALTAGVAPIVVGYLLAWTGRNWSVTFYLSAAVYALGALCWLFIDPTRRVEGT